MKQIIIILLLLQVNHILFSQDTITKNDSVNIKKTWVRNIDTLNPINGIKEGVIVYQTINNTLNGEFRIYDEKEVLRFKAIVFDEKKEGLAYSYTRRGNLEEVISYSNDVVISRMFLDHKRRPYRIVNYNFKGVKHGEEVSFFKNGNNRIKKIWNNGVLERYTYFYRNGNIRTVYFQDDEEKWTRIEHYNRNGSLKSITDF